MLADLSGPKKTERLQMNERATAVTEMYELIFLNFCVIRLVMTAETKGARRRIQGIEFIR